MIVPMNAAETREKILTDSNFVLDETKKIQYLYKLKQEIRYGQMRSEDTESVAEHIYGMHINAAYFIPLEDRERVWNTAAIYSMITWHDIDEVETGDIIGYKKTDADRAKEHTATKLVIQKSPLHMQQDIERILAEYQGQKTIEARFVKALDKLEPLFQIYNENGKGLLQKNKTTYINSRTIKDPYVEAFPCMKQFNEVLNIVMDREGFYYHDA